MSADELLRSLRDLEAEHAAGDLDDHNYQTLRDDYTARAAAALRGAELVAAAARPKTARWRRQLIIVATVAAAVGAGVTVARMAGERVGSQGLTGSINAAGGDRSAEVTKLLDTARQSLATEPLASLQSFDAVLAIDPRNPEAMAYGGWLVRIVAQSAEGEARTELIDRARERLDNAVEVAPGYPDARAFRGILRLRDLDDPVGANADFTALDALDPPDFVRQLVASARDEAAAAVTSAMTTAPQAAADSS
jgi:hypothetical protein